jgi:hypothetical protein
LGNCLDAFDAFDFGVNIFRFLNRNDAASRAST